VSIIFRVCNPIERRTEQWRPILGCEGSYEASSHGRVRSLPRTDRLGRPVPGGILTPGARPNGYRFVVLYVDGRRRLVSVHVLIAATFLGPCPDGQEVRHLNGDRADCYLGNLAYGTRSRNQLDATEHGTQSNARKVCCPVGHRYTPENTYVRPPRREGLNVRRECRTCVLDRVRRHRALGTEQ
jgi:hypothetical protein